MIGGHIKQLPLWRVDVRLSLYCRVGIDYDRCRRYAASLGDILDVAPIEVNQDNILIDGCLRLEAARRSGWSEVPVVVTETASAREVLLLGIRFNMRNGPHGKPLTDADRQLCATLLYAQSVTAYTVLDRHDAVVRELAVELDIAEWEVRRLVARNQEDMIKDRRKVIQSAVLDADHRPRRKRNQAEQERLNAQICAEVLAGKTYGEIAEKFAIPAHAVGRIARAGLGEVKEQQREERKRRDAQICAEIKDGATYAEVGRKHGLSDNRVGMIFRTITGVARVYAGAESRSERDEKIRELAFAGLQNTEIAEQFGLSHERVSVIIRMGEGDIYEYRKQERKRRDAQVRAAIKSGATYADIRERFGLGNTMIWNISKGD